MAGRQRLLQKQVLRESRGTLRSNGLYATNIKYQTKIILMFYAYLLECQGDNSWYIGYTDDLKARVARHNAGTGARTTSLKQNWKLIYYEAYISKTDALGREKFLKSGSGRNYLKKQLKNYLLK